MRWSDLPKEPAGTARRGSRSVVTVHGPQEAVGCGGVPGWPSAEVVGPAIIEEPEATAFISQGERPRYPSRSVGGCLVRVDPITLEVARNEFWAWRDKWARCCAAPPIRPTSKSEPTARPRCFVPNGEMLAQAEHPGASRPTMPASVAAVWNTPTWNPASHTHQRPVPRWNASQRPDVGSSRARGRRTGWLGGRSCPPRRRRRDSFRSMPAHATTVDQEGHEVPPIAAVRDGEWISSFS